MKIFNFFITKNMYKGITHFKDGSMNIQLTKKQVKFFADYFNGIESLNKEIPE